MRKKHSLKKFSKVWFVPLLLVVVMDTSPAYAVSPGPVNLGTAADFAVLGNASITNTGNTVVNGGDVGSGPTGFSVSNFPPGIVTPPGTLYTAANAAMTAANTALGLAYDDIAARTPDQTFNLNTDGITADGQLDGRTLLPGIYRIAAATSFQLRAAATLTLNAAGDSSARWIFQIPGTTFRTGGASQILLQNLANACNVYWQVGTSATLGATSLFKGNILADTSITLGNSVTALGAVLAGAKTTSGAVVLDNDAITGCAPAATLTVIKTLINDSGGTKPYVSDFPLFVGARSVQSGVATTFNPGTYTVTETNTSGYSASAWGGACSASGVVTVANGDNKTCTITNNDVASVAPTIVVPPLISIEKLPNPLSLPSGSGLVTYTYTVTNVGPVPIHNVSVIDNKCAPVTYVSGDTNVNSILGLTETWIFRCAKLISETTTNSATAVGYSEGISTTDVAFATVVVGLPIPPPLILVTKTPSRFVLPFGGGSVTYTYKVSNPGTTRLSNVRVVDDKCTNMSSPTGDTNGNNLLGISETWVYTCTMTITRNTVNTVTATGIANGFTATDVAVVTVLVTPTRTTPRFPNTGIGPDEKNTPWNLIIPVGLIAGLILLYGVRRKQIH